MSKYRVIVMREGETKDETLFELAGSAAMVAGIVPTALANVLAADQDSQRVMAVGEQPAPAPSQTGGTLADRVFDAAAAAGGAAADQALAAAEAKTKRTRRTKAQIAADEQAVALGFRDAAHRQQAEQAAPAEQGGEPAPAPATVTTAFENAAPIPPATPTAAPDGQPWNPFQQG